MTNPEDKRPIQVQMIEANGRWEKYEKDNKGDHKAIIQRLGRVDVVIGILKVLGILVLALIGSAAGFIIGGANWVSTLQDNIEEVRRVGSTEGRALDMALRKDISRLELDMRECQRIHRLKSGKD